MSAITDILVPGCRALAPDVFRNGGTTVFKPGYHGPRDWMRKYHPSNYSIQLAKDLKGPATKGSAFDWTFSDAQAGNYETIAKFSRRLYKAGQDDDPRAYPLREFQGNIDSDRTVEGWSYYRGHALTTSDTSHLWHIHFSIWRQYIDNIAAMRSILSILKGEDDDDMPLTDADWAKFRRIVQQEVAKVWEADVIPNPTGDAGNPTLVAKNSVAEIRIDTDAILKKLDS